MKRFSIVAIAMIVLCAIALIPLVSANGDDVWQYHYWDYYYDSQGNMIGWGYSVFGAFDNDVATDRAYITRYHVQRTDGTWESLTGSGSYYEKDDDGNWVYWGGSWYEWSWIWNWIING